MARNDVRAAAYDMPGYYIENNDPIAIYDIAGEAIARARAGGGPSLIEIETFRLAGHFMGDAEAYRPEGEKESLGSRDPIPAFRALLQSEGVTSTQLDELEASAESEVAEAISFAQDSDYAPVEDALTHVFA